MNSKYLLPRFSIRTAKTKDIHRDKGAFLYNILAFLIVISVFTLISWGTIQVKAPIDSLTLDPITLDPVNLISYSFRTALRMIVAMIFSLIFSLVYATLAAKNEKLEQILIPLLDTLQSVPVLGYIAFTVTAFLALFPNKVMGAEAAAIFAIFTAQAWNMTFSVYQSLTTIPKELLEAADLFKMSKWRKFWIVEVAYSIPGLSWNILVSMSSGWFFVVASEVILVGNNQITLPGIGSYISLALAKQNSTAIIYAIIAMTSVIILYDQMLLRPLISWSDKFRYDNVSSIHRPRSWVLDLFRKSLIVNQLFLPIKYLAKWILYLPILNNQSCDTVYLRKTKPNSVNIYLNYVWYLSLCIVGAISIYYLFNFLENEITVSEIIKVVYLASITLLRIATLILLVSLIWVPIGIYIGLNPQLAKMVQPFVQFFAAFPINLLFPIVFIFITRYDLDPNIWLSPLMIAGTQWYILFNVIAGASSFPNELREVAQIFEVKGWAWLCKVILPAITPHYLTGAIAASGGAWNASIVAEVINFGDKKITALGIGSYITEMTVSANFQKITLGIAVMSLFVVTFNRLFWQPLHDFSKKKFQL